MRLTPIALAVGLAVATMASAGQTQRADDQIDPRSVALTQKGEALNAAGQYADARDMLESALVVDPRNRAAFIGLAHAAQGQGLPGKAIKLYSEALKLEPNDLAALEGQGEAMVQRGAVARAKQNLAKIKTLCKATCPQAGALAAVIAKGPPAEALAARTTDDTPDSDQN